MRTILRLFRVKPSEGDIVETPLGEKGVVTQMACDSWGRVVAEVRHCDDERQWYDIDELVRVDGLYRLIDRFCNWLGV